MTWALLTFSPVRDAVLALGNILYYFVLVFNGSDFLVVGRRDMNATWGTLGTYCREHDKSRGRLVDELQNGALPWRTIPEGCEAAVDWHNPEVTRSLDIEASTVLITRGCGEKVGNIVFALEAAARVRLYIEVLWPPGAPADAEHDGPQAHRVRMALDRLKDRGLVLSEHTRAQLRRRIGKELDAEARRTHSSDLPPSRQVMDKVLRAVGVK